MLTFVRKMIVGGAPAALSTVPIFLFSLAAASRTATTLLGFTAALRNASATCLTLPVITPNTSFFTKPRGTVSLTPRRRPRRHAAAYCECTSFSRPGNGMQEERPCVQHFQPRRTRGEWREPGRGRRSRCLRRGEPRRHRGLQGPFSNA